MDKIPVQVSDVTDELVVPVYPVVKYGHVPGGGDAIGAGFLYNVSGDGRADARFTIDGAGELYM